MNTPTQPTTTKQAAPKAPKPAPVRCGRIASHAGWYCGEWVTDTCHCGHAFRVPAGDRGSYQCNCCAARAEGFFDD